MELERKLHLIAYLYTGKPSDSENVMVAAGALVDGPLVHRDVRQPMDGGGGLAETWLVVLKQVRLQDILQHEFGLAGGGRGLEAVGPHGLA